MASIYVIHNKEKNTRIEVNELLILDTIKVLKYRKPKLSKIWIDKIESLEKKNFSEETLEY